MKNLKEIIEGQELELIQGSLDKDITDLIIDSRKAVKDCVFFCFIGANSDAHAFVPDVVKAAPAAIVVQKDIPITPEMKDITILKAKDTRYALALASARFFDQPAAKMKTVAITGTKGKTSITSMVRLILEKAGIKTGSIGTVGAFLGGDTFIATKTTTPESYDVESFMNEMVKNGCGACVMEVSSQALMLNRVAGITFDYGLFTNLSPDHIGGAEHKDFADYVHCKSLLFRQCRHGFFNYDDAQYEAMTKDCTCTVSTYSCEKESDLKAADVEYLREGDFIGMSFRTEGRVSGLFKVSAPGEFSVYNALAAISVCHAMGVSDEVIRQALTEVHVKGRMEPVPISSRFHLLIDYAHNGMAMESILKAFRKYHPKRIVSLFGCGGNRARDRRFTMGEISGRLADFSILTADNSRFEKVEDILADIEVGMKKTDGKYIIIPDRKEAIRYSIEHAEEGDIILLLGKGHEDYQEIEGVRRPFDERVIIREILDEIGWKYE